jgi:hypothetical protein
MFAQAGVMEQRFLHVYLHYVLIYLYLALHSMAPSLENPSLLSPEHHL